MKYRLFAPVCAAALMLTALTGCGEKQQSAETDLPYGATITEYTRDSMKIACDARFITPEVVDLIEQYYLSIENQDGEALQKLLFPLYNNYQLEEVYGGEISNQDLVETTHDAIEEYFGFDFAYSYIEITDLITKDAQSNSRDSLAAMLDSLAEEKGEPKVSDETDALWEMTVDRCCDKKDENQKTETEYTLTGETLYAIQYRGQWYLMYS